MHRPKLALACALLLTPLPTLAPDAAAAREIELSWVATGATVPDAYIALLRTSDGGDSMEIDLGRPETDEDGVHTVRLAGVPSEELVVALRARARGGESAPSNEILVPAATPAFDEISVFVADGRRHPLVDGAESRTLAIAGVPHVAVAEMDGRGKLSGTAASDLDGDGLYETRSSLSGRVRGRHERAFRRLELWTRARDLRLSALHETAFDGGAGVVTELRSARGRVDGEPVRLDEAETASLLPHEHAWMLTFGIDEDDGGPRKPARGSLVLASGRSLPVAGRARARKDGSWKVRLRSRGEDAGVRVKLDDLELTPARRIVSGRMRYRAFGQRGRLDLASVL